MQVSSAILFVSLFSCVIIEKALSKITSTEHIFNAKSLKRGQLPVSTSPGCGSGYPSIITKCFLRISVKFPVCFPVFGAVMALNKNSFGTDIRLLATSQDTVVCSQLQFNFLFFSEISFDNYFLLNCYT